MLGKRAVTIGIDHRAGDGTVEGPGLATDGTCASNLTNLFCDPGPPFDDEGV